jgi:hypothetical protein
MYKQLFDAKTFPPLIDSDVEFVGSSPTGIWSTLAKLLAKLVAEIIAVWLTLILVRCGIVPKRYNQTVALVIQ